MANAYRDENMVPTLIGVSSVDGVTPVRWKIDPVTGRALVDSAGGSSSLVIGTTAITGGTATRVLYDNAGVLGEYTLTGTGTVVAMQTSPTFNTSINVAGVIIDASDINVSTNNALVISTNNTNRWSFSATGHFLALTDNTYDIGATGATRPRTVYVGTSVISPSFVGTLTGNASTVTTNANLTGPVTSVGNATSIASSVALPGSPTTTTQTQADNSTKISTTAYVDLAVANAVAGVNPAVAVTAATTQASDTSGLTYNNGVSGIGATFTGANNTALTIDGVTFTALGQRLLVKNDTQSPSGAFNGVYYVTQIQTAILPPILTRALDYDQPSDINNTGAIPIVSGTANANTSWLLTSTVVTVGTTPLTYVQFSLAPSTLVTLTGTQTLTNKRITKRVLALSANSATPAINTDSYDVVHITSQTTAITSFTTNLTGTPVDGDSLRISVTGTGAVGLTFGSSFEASGGVPLSTTTVTTARLDMGFFWNTETSKWRQTAQA